MNCEIHGVDFYEKCFRERCEKCARALSSGKYRQTRVKRQCLGRVVCDLTNCYVELGVRTSLHDLSREQSPCGCNENSKIKRIPQL